jgi:hypothetical protein
LARNDPGVDVGDDKAATTFAVGATVQLLVQRMKGDGPIEPHAMVPEIMHRIVKLYLGEEAAREELALLPPERADAGHDVPAKLHRSDDRRRRRRPPLAD